MSKNTPIEYNKTTWLLSRRIKRITHRELSQLDMESMNRQESQLDMESMNRRKDSDYTSMKRQERELEMEERLPTIHM